MAIQCVWCGKEIEELENVATMDTCDNCEDYFEEHIDDIIAVLNEMLVENEKCNVKDDSDKANIAWKSYSIISAIHMLSAKPNIEFKDSRFKDFIGE